MQQQGLKEADWIAVRFWVDVNSFRFYKEMAFEQQGSKCFSLDNSSQCRFTEIHLKSSFPILKNIVDYMEIEFLQLHHQMASKIYQLCNGNSRNLKRVLDGMDRRTGFNPSIHPIYSLGWSLSQPSHTIEGILGNIGKVQNLSIVLSV